MLDFFPKEIMSVNITKTGSIMKNTWVQDLKDVGQGEVTSEGQEVNVPTWTEFTQNTTFHGVKYIFGDSQKIRR